MNFLWFSWKDPSHPLAGGAEGVSNKIMKSLIRDGHEVKLITSSYKGSKPHETVDSIEIFRVGSRFSVYLRAFLLYRKQFRHWPDIVIDEMNTIPFGCAFYSRQRCVLLTYQLARKVWFHQMPFPLSLVGYLAEPIYLFLLSIRYREVITESESTRRDLARYGFRKSHVNIFRVGISIEPAASLPPKASLSTILILGAIRSMKRTLDAVKGFEVARDKNDTLNLTIAGDDSGPYARKVSDYVKRSRHSGHIKVLGRVSAQDKIHLMKTATLIVVTSVKEGWGLIVTEANSQGTPAVVYDIDGLRDSVKPGVTGEVVSSRPDLIGEAINRLLSDKSHYEKLRLNAWDWSKQFTDENSYRDFIKALGIESPGLS